MDQISNISKQAFKKSITKKRNTFWQMMKCIAKFQYKPSLLLILTFIGATIYIISPIPFFEQQPFFIRILDDVLILFVVLKVCSHETHRYNRHKAKSRRYCE
ncbi:MAG: hypothetical protein IT256_02665 [Chitinophagaceae bacterium]|nr:hypothetical protein [Chitinophagaceae bacterium]